MMQTALIKRGGESKSIKLINITAGYNGLPVIRNLSFTYKGRGLIQVLGPNGAGKTTLLKVITGLIKPVTGKVFINNIDVTGKPMITGKIIGYVPQIITGSSRDFPITVWELLEQEYLFLRKRWPRILAGEKTIVRIEKTLMKVGLTRDAWNKPFKELSGGQKQRVLIARALLHEPQVHLMDEPLSSIDPKGRGSISRLIGEISRDNLVIVTSHDPILLLKYTSIIILLGDGKYYVGKPDEVLCMEVLKKIYGEAAVKISGMHIHISDTACRKK